MTEDDGEVIQSISTAANNGTQANGIDSTGSGIAMVDMSSSSAITMKGIMVLPFVSYLEKRLCCQLSRVQSDKWLKYFAEHVHF